MSDTLAIYRVLKYCTPVFSKISARVGSAKVSSLSQTTPAAVGGDSGVFKGGGLAHKISIYTSTKKNQQQKFAYSEGGLSS